MKKMLKYIAYFNALVFPVLLSVSCGREETVAFRPLDLVETAVSDTASPAAACLRGYADLGNAGAIAVFGGFEETAVLAEKLLTCDKFDNIDAKERPDGLPDFSGETVMPVFDAVNAPYTDYMAAANEDFIRELAVKGFLSMISGHCASSAFDHGSSASKPRAKMVIFSSSLMSEFGIHDIDCLTAAAGISTGVLDPVTSAVKHVFRHADTLSNIGVWAESNVVSSGVYGNVFRDIRSACWDRHSHEYRDWARTSEIVCLSPEPGSDAGESVRRFFDAYLSADYHTPLSGVILDDFTRSSEVDSLNAALDGILMSETRESEIYRQLIVPGFRFISPVETLAEDCYRWLRENGRFTHLVALPGMSGYMTVVSSEVQGGYLDKDGWLDPEFKYNRAPGSGVETFRFIPLSQSYFSAAAMERMKELAPETYKRLIYVY